MHQVKQTVGFNDPNLFHKCLWKEEEQSIWDMQYEGSQTESGISGAVKVEFLCCNFRSCHHQWRPCPPGYAVFVWAGLSSGKLRTSTRNACFRTLSMCIFKIGQERKHLNLRISAKRFQRRQKNPCGKASDHIWDTQHCKGSISRKEVMRLMSLMESRLITNFLFGLITIMVSFHVYTPVCVCCVHAIIPQV